MPFLHAHRRRVPAQNVDRSVHVGVRAVTTMLTNERRLALAARYVYGPAVRTGLRSVCRVDGDKMSAALIQLVFQDVREHRPSLLKNGPVEASLLPDRSSGVLNCSLGCGRHASDLQVFHNDGAKSARHFRRDVVQPMLPDSAGFGVESFDALPLLEISLRSPLAARQGALRGPTAAVDRAERDGSSEAFPGGQRNGVRYASVYTNSRIDIGRRRVLDLARESYVPSIGRQVDGGSFHLSPDRPSVPELYPAHLWHASSGPAAIDALYGDFPSLETEGLVHVLFPGRGVAGNAAEKPVVGLIEIAQRLFLNDARYSGNPIEFGAKLRQLTALAREAYVKAGVLFEMAEPIAALLKSKVVDQPANASELPKQGLLLRCWSELISKAAMHNHEFVLTLFGSKINTTREVRP